MNIRELLKEGVSFLDASDTALLDCEVLLKHVLGVESDFLVSHIDDEVSPDMADLFMSYLERVQEGEPIAYITNEKEFFGLNFFVDDRVLIPRPETEHLVEAVFEYVNEIKGDSGFRILDVGTGSGNIAISVARALSDEGVVVDIDAIDISEDALDVARLNAEQHGVEDRIQFYQSDLLENFDDDEDFDVIIANLPYIGEVKHRHVSGDTEKYEPNGALFAGEDGLDLYKKMFQQIVDKKLGYKRIFGEFCYGQSEDISLLLNKYFEHRWEIKKDLAGIDRMFIVSS
ncbi:peptide chain release factor N(5)-glutamine methyltransferase [Candidatus Peregrinibacteria bacterium]|jgi:release factor glutamine methyltransferase|nr:peptide chain release factor N(5)-glutamine methyltransferase [Candidatus Peregrinibacteria bacterium]